MFGIITLDLETKKQIATQAIECRLDSQNITDVEENYWDAVMTEIENMEEGNPEKLVRQADRKLRKIRRATERMKCKLDSSRDPKYGGC